MNTLERDAQIVQMSKKQKTLKEIGEHFCLSRERIRQILISNNIDPRKSGAFLRSISRQNEKQEEKDVRNRKVWGITGHELIVFKNLLHKNELYQNEVDSIIKAYTTQRSNVHRLVGKNMWNLSITDWWKIWMESGQWSIRGRGLYCLSRIILEKPFSVDNAEVRLYGEMIRDRHLARGKCK